MGTLTGLLVQYGLALVFSNVLLKRRQRAISTNSLLFP